MCGLGQSHHPCEPQFPSEDAAGRVGDQMGSRVPKGRTGRSRPDRPTGDRQTPGATQRQGTYSWQPVSQEGAGHLGKSEGP